MAVEYLMLSFPTPVALMAALTGVAAAAWIPRGHVTMNAKLGTVKT